jgi:hypothetical protein
VFPGSYPNMRTEFLCPHCAPIALLRLPLHISQMFE